METPDLDICRILSAKHGLPMQFVIKDFYQMDVLSQLSARQSGFGNPVFKGGTALNKIYLGGLQRFSEDLDFDVETNGKGAKRIAGEIAASLHGYEIGEIRKVGGTFQFECKFASPLGGKDHIRIDLAPKRIVTSEKPIMSSVSSPFSQKSVAGVLAYGLEDLLARKLCALASRAEGKDFYDVHSALPKCKKMGKAISAMLKSEGSSQEAGEFIKSAIEKVRVCDSKKLAKLTNPFIPLPNRPKSWEELKGNLMMELKKILEI